MANQGVPVNGKKLKELRQKKNLSQEQLAKLSFHENCYIPIETLKRAESSDPMSDDVIQNICAFFGITQEEIVAQNPEKDARKQI